MKEKGKEKGDVCVFILSFPSLWPYKGQKMEQLLYTKLHKFVGTTKKKTCPVKGIKFRPRHFIQS